MRKVFKYATGQEIPDGAVYLNTVKQVELERPTSDPRFSTWEPCWLVWHYFLVEVDASDRVVAPPVGGSR